MSKTLRNLYMTVIALILIAPLFVIAAISFNEKKFLSFPPKGFSFRWYVEIFADDAWFGALQHSLAVAACAALLAVSIALPIAYCVWRYGFFYARALLSLGVSPFVLPPVIMALAFLLFFTTVGVHGKMINVILAHSIFLVALPLVTISLGLESVSKEMIEAGRTLGADDKTVFRSVTLPIIRPYLISGFAFAFVLSLNEYIIAFMTVGFTVETLPIKIFNSLRYGYTPVMASVAVLFIVVNVVIFGLIGRFGNLPKLLGAWSEER
ncbi:MAG TPA: ABC transporter permease [Kiloniellaceae bacterium]|nr:ABC transporter permease [Kiloniellaceae bacterium]